MNELTLGKEVEDIVTKFRGIVTGRAEYITGCEQFLVVPQSKKPDGELHESKWIDIDRLVVVGEGVSIPQHTSNGCDMQAPRK